MGPQKVPPLTCIEGTPKLLRQVRRGTFWLRVQVDSGGIY